MIYRKRGRVARWEHGTLVVIDEAGEAIEERGVFEVRPWRAGAPAGRASADWPARAPALQTSAVERLARDIEKIAKPEHLVISHGFADHDADGIRWSDETRRVHVAITHNGIRALIDRADFDLDEIQRVAGAMKRAGAEREAPPRIRLAPSVAAALLPVLVGVAPPNVTLWQTGGGFDGNGQQIDDVPIIAPPWPNVFRPSYRIAPLRTPLSLRLECAVDVIDRDIPEAIALLAPVRGLTFHVLIDDGKRVYPAHVRVVRIDAVSRQRVWYPYAAGAFGAEIML